MEHGDRENIEITSQLVISFCVVVNIVFTDNSVVR